MIGRTFVAKDPTFAALVRWCGFPSGEAAAPVPATLCNLHSRIVCAEAEPVDDFGGISDGGALRRLNVLYLVAELEEAIVRGGVTWTEQDAERIPERLARLASTLRQQASN